MALLPGSAAIGAGLGRSNINTDQRGAPRATSGPVDIGAVQVSLVVESGAGTVDTSLPSLTLPGAVSLADTYADSLITFAFQGNTTTTLAATLHLSNTTGTTTIDGPACKLTVSGGNAVGVFSVAKNVTASLSGLTITGGSSANYGGGVNNQGTLTLTGCTVSGNSAGGWRRGLQRGTLTLTGCTVSGNSAADGGGVHNVGTLTLTGCTVSGNSASVAGGILDVIGSATLTDCTVSANSASLAGGVFINAGTATLTDCTVSANSASLAGGGIANGGIIGALSLAPARRPSPIAPSPATPPPKVAASTTTCWHGDPGEHDRLRQRRRHRAGRRRSRGHQPGPQPGRHRRRQQRLGRRHRPHRHGRRAARRQARPAGRLRRAHPDHGPLARQRRHRRRARPEQHHHRPAGAAATSGPVDIGTVQVSLVVESGAGTVDTSLPALTLPGAVSLADTYADSLITFAFQGNTTTTLAATLHLSNTTGTTTIDGPAGGVTVSGGNAVGVFSVAKNVTASISGLTISGGSATNGGGVYNRGTLTLTGCTVSGNSAGKYGGGVSDYSILMLTNCTVSGNSSGSFGGGILSRGGALTLTDCTLSGNSSGNGGGLFNQGTATLTDCTISGNSAKFHGGGAGQLRRHGHAHRLHHLRQLGRQRTAAACDNAARPTLTDCTISGNSASVGGGLYNYTGTVYHGTADAHRHDRRRQHRSSTAASDIGGSAPAPSPARTT